jgi:hypothetical protein
MMAVGTFVARRLGDGTVKWTLARHPSGLLEDLPLHPKVVLARLGTGFADDLSYDLVGSKCSCHCCVRPHDGWLV